MSVITAAMVKELRDRTQAGMMEAKKILTETNGDMDAAIKLMREKNKDLTVKDGRTSAEGVIESFVSSDSTLGVLVEVNSETDFVARNDEFVALAKDLAKHASENPTAEHADALLDIKMSATGEPARTRLQETFAKLRENIIFKQFAAIQSDNATVYAYVHMGGQIGTLVEMKGTGPEIKSLAREVAMHIAAAKPKYLSRADVPTNVVAAEREIVKTRTMADPKNASKTPENLEKTIESGVGTFFKANVLLEQPYVRDGKQSIEQLITGKSEIVSFIRYEIGEASA